MAGEVDRMLAWFRTTLPQHDLAEWYVWLRPHHITLTDQRANVMMPSAVGLGHAVGECRCLRCGQRWSIDEGRLRGSLWVADSSRDSYDKVIAAVREVLQKRAARDGPCWGDVPSAGEPTASAVLD